METLKCLAMMLESFCHLGFPFNAVTTSVYSFFLPSLFSLFSLFFFFFFYVMSLQGSFYYSCVVSLWIPFIFFLPISPN